MDAPSYPPATAFEHPASAASVISLEEFSLAELMKMPAAWEIILKHAPSLKFMTGSAMIKPHLGNFTVFSLAAFGIKLPPVVVATINAELARLPRVGGTLP